MGSQESRRAPGRSARTVLDLSLFMEGELIRLTAKVKTGPVKGLTRSVEADQEAIAPCSRNGFASSWPSGRDAI
jgi:hypothetical protein